MKMSKIHYNDNDYGFFCELDNNNTIITNDITECRKNFVISVLEKDYYDSYDNYKHTNVIIHQYSNAMHKIMIALTFISTFMLWYQFWCLQL